MHKIEVNDKIYKVKILKTEDEQEKGLQGIKELPEDEGALFVLEEPTDCSIWMKDTYIPLMIVFIGEDEEVIKISYGEPLDETDIECSDVKYILEINPTEGIEEGDEVDLNIDEEVDDNDEAKKIKEYVILGSNGEVVMSFSGVTKIFSRSNTKTLIKFAKKAASAKSDSSYETLGKKLFKFLKTQDSNQEETVEIK